MHRPVADARDLERAAALLTGARRVAIVAGDGAAVSKAGPEVLALAEALAAVATTLGARGIIPTTHRLSAGQLFSAAGQPHRAQRRPGAVHRLRYRRPVTLNWQIPPLNTPIVQIEADPLEIGRSYPNTTGLVGDPKATVARLVHIVGRPTRDPGFAEEAARIVAEWRASMAPLVEKNTAPITVERLCAEVTRLARGWGPRGRYRLFRHLDRHDDRAEWRRADLSARGRLARLGLSGVPRREMRLVTARCSVLPAMAASTITSPNWRRHAAATSRS